MSLIDLIRGKSTPRKFATATPATFATDTREAARTVATVATVAVAESKNSTPENPANDPQADPAAEARRQRAIAMLTANPALRLAVVCDGEGDPVPVAVAIRDKGTCEVLIPASRFDPFALLELVGRHGGTVH